MIEHRDPELEMAILAAQSAADLDEPLARLFNSGPTLLATPKPEFRLFMPGIDAAIPHVAQVLKLADQPSRRSNHNVCIVASQFYAVGGHTRVAADISQLIGQRATTVILTNLYRNLASRAVNDPIVNAMFQQRAFLLLKSPKLVDRTIELYQLLKAIRPSRILLLNHHLDVCAVAATYPFREITDFLHHADHQLCLGATLPYRHVDLTHFAHGWCCDAGLNPVYSSTGTSTAALAPPARDLPLKLATCGHQAKYRRPGRVRWADWVVGLLKNNAAEMIHIGAVDDAFVQEVRSALACAQLDPTRYVFLGNRPNLPAELAARNATVFVGSAPEGGGRSIVEALAARIPVIVPVDPDRAPVMRFSLPLSGWVEILDPEDGQRAIDRCEELRSVLAREPFELELQAELGRFAAFVADDPLPPVPRRSGAEVIGEDIPLRTGGRTYGMARPGAAPEGPRT